MTIKPHKEAMAQSPMTKHDGNGSEGEIVERENGARSVRSERERERERIRSMTEIDSSKFFFFTKKFHLFTNGNFNIYIYIFSLNE